MPRDDLSIDFVKKMPPVEAMDPALLLDEWLNRAQNLPEEIRFLQEEIAEKDRQYNQCIKEIEDRDGRIQKFIKANGSHAENPKEVEWRATIVKNYDTAERLAQEKVTLANKMQHTMDKHLRHLDMQMKLLYDRNEPGFNDPDEVPSLVRESAANITKPPTLNPFPSTLNNTAAAPATSAAPQAVSIRASHPQLKTNTQHAASAPATPAASMILGRQARESSAGPSGAPKRGPRAALALGNLPTSGLARHSSLGPGTPKSQHQTATGAQRAGSAGPRANTKGTAGPGRKASTPSGSFVRKKSMPAGGAAGGGAGGAAGNKSGLSRVKRTAKNSPSSTADSELSDAEDLSGEDSGTSRRATPAARSSSHPNNGNGSGGANKEGSNDRDAASGPSGSNRKEGGASGPGGNAGGNGHSTGGTQLGRVRTAAADSDDDDDDAMDVDEDEAGDDKKYCLCQNVSFGDMVACDNEDCPYEWFHWGCVGLKSEPNGAWFCPQCTEDRKKKG